MDDLESCTMVRFPEDIAAQLHEHLGQFFFVKMFLEKVGLRKSTQSLANTDFQKMISSKYKFRIETLTIINKKIE